jgi:hypothetical protein
VNLKDVREEYQAAETCHVENAAFEENGRSEYDLGSGRQPVHKMIIETTGEAGNQISATIRFRPIRDKVHYRLPPTA